MGNLRKAFLAIEYTVLIAVFVAALLGISVYLKRAISGKWRSAADTFGFGRQYYPGETQCFDEAGRLINCNE